MAKITYKRVSSRDQCLYRQTNLLEKLGPFEREYEEKISGKNAARPKLQEMLTYVREGDTVYIESISRLARSLRDFLWIFDTLKEKKVQLISLKENIDTSSAAGVLQVHLFAALAQFERECTLERQREGYEARRAQGLPVGRPPREFPDKWDKVYKDWENKLISISQALETLKIPKATFYKLIEKSIKQTGKQPLHWDNGQKIVLRQKKV